MKWLTLSQREARRDQGRTRLARVALAIRGLPYRSVESILKAGLDAVPLPGAEPVGTIDVHPNVRGARYYE